jgi:hypothetical protein
MKLLWAREECVTCCSRKEKSVVYGRYLEAEIDEEGIIEWKMPSM